MSRADDEFEHVSLGDQHLSRRVVKIAERLDTSPKASVPKACGGWAETKAAHQFFDHAEVTSQQVLAPHVKKTRERMKREPVVWCLNDTIACNFYFAKAPVRFTQAALTSSTIRHLNDTSSKHWSGLHQGFRRIQPRRCSIAKR